MCTTQGSLDLLKKKVETKVKLCNWGRKCGGEIRKGLFCVVKLDVMFFQCCFQARRLRVAVRHLKTI